jgi:hypothetical protein
MFQNSNFETICVSDHRVRWFQNGARVKTLDITVVDESSLEPVLGNIDSLEKFPNLEKLILRSYSLIREREHPMTDSTVLHPVANLKYLELRRFAFKMQPENNVLLYILCSSGVEDIFFYYPHLDEWSDNNNVSHPSFEEWIVHFFKQLQKRSHTVKIVRVKRFFWPEDAFNVERVRAFFQTTSIQFWLE